MREARRSSRPGALAHASRYREVQQGRAWGLERRPGSLRRRAGRRRLARSGGAVLLAAGVLTAAALLPSGGSHDAQLGPTPASAAIALDRAASTAMRQTAVYPTARQYEYVMVQEGVTSSGGFAGVGVRFWQSDTKQDWYRADGSGRERIVSSREGFLAPSDRSIARAHGLSLAQFMPNQDGDSAYPGVGAYYSDYDPAGLPTQPAALLRAIKSEVRASRTTPTATAGATVSEVATASVFEVIADRLLFASTSPALRAALYRVIAHLPGVQLLGWQTDKIGRRGIAVAISHAEVGDEATRRELLFDPTSGEPLQTQLIQTAPLTDIPGTAPLPRGTVLRYTAFIKRGVVNSIEDLPGGGRRSYHHTVGGGR
ncbi:MAG TPA: CU044_5270 family protein [Solirubrobacteraceae bacterium]